MNKLKKIFTIILLFTFIYLLFRYNFILQKSVNDAVILWLSKVFPSLFIMFILNDLIINSHILDSIFNLISPLFNKIYNVSGTSLECFILCIFSGTPTSAYIIKEMLNNNSINESDANKLISFTFFSNPLFLYNILSMSFNKFITLKIIIIHYLTNLIIGLFYCKNKSNNINYKINMQENTNIIKLIPNAISKSFNTLLMILGTITFYMIVSNYILKIIPLNIFGEVIIRGILEITQSLNILPSLNIISNIKEITALSIISFGGLSIHTQILNIINDTPIKYKNFLIGRILHVLLSTLLYYFTNIIINS